VGVLTAPKTVYQVSACTFTFCGVANDPQFQGAFQSALFELDRCCLLRSLLSYNGRDISDGGATLRPDLAASLPQISSDGLTWTFHLRSGIHYGPPLQTETVSAQDFVRSIERILSPRPAWIPSALSWGGPYFDDAAGSYLNLAGAIAGAKAYGAGNAQHISGLQAPDDHTLVVHLTHASGNLGYLLALPDTAPIPPVPSHPDWRFGAAQGHERVYSSYLVSTGPYMIDGAPQLDFSRPPQQQLPALGDAPDSLTLVRNPSWQPASDPLRAALPNRIELVPVKDERAALRLTRRGTIDFALNWHTPPSLLPASGSPVRPLDAIAYLSLNMAMPPLDDVHVRRAINYAIARQPLVPLWNKAQRPGVPATHIGLDDQENDLLLNFDPYRATTGDLKSAKHEMVRSRYDSNHDGRCDGSVCRGIRLWTQATSPQSVATARQVARDLKRIGLGVHAYEVGDARFLSTDADPSSHVEMRLNGWLKNTPSASDYFTALFGGSGLEPTNISANESHVGATPAELRRWGYPVRHVPSVDTRIRQCLPETFAAQVSCFAALDQYLTTRVVPWVPLITRVTARLTSSRVSHFDIDPSPVNPMPALDRVVLQPGTNLRRLPEPSYAFPGVPDGVYRYMITKADLLRVDPKFTHADILENTGTYTWYLRHGRFEYVNRADHPILNAVAAGIFKGQGHRIMFQVQQPVLNGYSTPSMEWSFNGHALHLRVLGCGNLDQGTCNHLQAIYEAHPWVKIADLP
jgi:peptide/nickel transport system substrate-binding protein